MRRPSSWWIVALACCGCAPGPAPQSAAQSVEPPAPPLQLGALTEFVPAPGLRWLVTGSPQYWAQQAAFAGLRERWLTEPRLRAFAQATGIALESTEHAAVAGFDLGTLYLVDASGWKQKPEQPFIERLAGSARVQRPHPKVWRVTGLVGSTPEALVRLDDAVVAVAVKDPMLARIVEYRARGRLAHAVPALQGAALAGLPAEFRDWGPLRAYALGPWPASELPDGAGLLSAAGAGAAAVELSGPALRVRIALTGAWDEAQDREQLLALWQAFSTSTLGRAAGLDVSLAPATAQAAPDVLTLDLQLDAERVLAGLERIAGGRLEPLLGLPNRTETPESAH